MTTYLPNSTNCTGWFGYDTYRPADSLAMEQETEFTEDQYTDVSVDDENFHMSGLQPATKFMGHHIKWKITETEGDVTDLTITAKGYGHSRNEIIGPPPWNWYGYYLYIWNFDTTTWELLDSHTSSSKDTATGSITENWEDYIDGDGYVHGLVQNIGVAAWYEACYTYYIELEVTAVTGTNTQINISDAWKENPTWQIIIDDEGNTWKAVAGMQIIIDDGGNVWKSIF